MNISERNKVQARSIQLLDALEKAEGHEAIHKARVALNEYIGALIDLVSIYQRPEPGGVGVGPEMTGSRLKRLQDFYDMAHAQRDVEHMVTMTAHQMRQALHLVNPDRLDLDQLNSSVTIELYNRDVATNNPEAPIAKAGLYARDSEYPEEGVIYLEEAVEERDMRAPGWLLDLGVSTWSAGMVVPSPDLAKIEGDEIVIRLSKGALKHGTENSDAFFNIAENGGSATITDMDLYTKSFVSALNHELNDTGDTPVIQLFDRALSHVLEQGDDGIDVQEGDEEGGD